MADRTGIEWAEASVNPVRARDKATGKIGWHCEHATPGCEFCYAEAINRRLGTGHEFIRQNRDRIELFLDQKTLTTPLRWKRGRVIFWHSMTDAFAPFMRDDWLDLTFNLCTATPHHRHIFLTKRPDRMADYAARRLDTGLALGAAAMFAAVAHPDSAIRRLCDGRRLANVLLGCSVEDQRRADERREPMRRLAAAGWKTIVSYEPALGPVNWQGWEFLAGLISGGESSIKARGTPRYHYRQARDFCAANGIAYFHKQNGEWIDADEWMDSWRAGYRLADPAGSTGIWNPPRPLNFTDAQYVADFHGFRYEHHSDGTTLIRIGKKAAGRQLDGREHSELPA